jgi:hypothetical protein
MSDSETALAIMPKNELVQVEKMVAQQVSRAEKNRLKSAGVGLLGGAVSMGAMAVGVMASAAAAHVVVPVILGGFVLEMCGASVTWYYNTKYAKYTKRQTAAKAAIEEARRESLRTASESLLMRDAGACAVGKELCIEVPGETPKILRIELVGAALDFASNPVRKISARLYEAMTQADGSLKRGEHIAEIPEIACSMPLEQSSGPGSAEESADPAPPALPRSQVDKKLPPCTPRFGG